MIAIEFPKLRYNIVPTSDFIKQKITIQQWAENNSVDIIYLRPNDLVEFTDHNLLLELDTYIKRDAFPLDSLVPSVVELTKQYGNGEMYGLAPNYYSKALVFNKRLFDENKVEYPVDQMTWEEIMLLANRFEQGLSLSYASVEDWVMDISRTLNLQAYNEQTNTVTLSSPTWAKVFLFVKESLQSGSIIINDNSSSNNNLFVAGDYAMSIASYDELMQLEQQDELDWSLVTMPVNPSELQVGHFISVNGFFAISNSTPNADASWNLIQYLMSEKVAEAEYRSVHGFSSITSMDSKSLQERNIEAFYKLKPGKTPHNIPDQVYPLLNRVLERVMNENTAIEDILDEIQIESNK